MFLMLIRIMCRENSLNNNIIEYDGDDKEAKKENSEIWQMLESVAQETAVNQTGKSEGRKQRRQKKETDA